MARITKAQLEEENKKLREEIDPIAKVAGQLFAQAVARESEAREQGRAILTLNLPNGETVTSHARKVLE